MHSVAFTKQGPPNVPYRELPLQLMAVVRILLGNTELTLVGYVAVGLGILCDVSFSGVVNWRQVPDPILSKKIARTSSLTAREATK